MSDKAMELHFPYYPIPIVKHMKIFFGRKWKGYSLTFTEFEDADIGCPSPFAQPPDGDAITSFNPPPLAVQRRAVRSVDVVSRKRPLRDQSTLDTTPRWPARIIAAFGSEDWELVPVSEEVRNTEQMLFAWAMATLSPEATHSSEKNGKTEYRG